MTPHLFFLANRFDGLGQRLKSVVWGKVFANHYNAGFGFTWPERRGGKEIFHATGTAGEIFSHAFLDTYFLEGWNGPRPMNYRELVDHHFPDMGPSLSLPATVRAPMSVTGQYREKLTAVIGRSAFRRAFDEIEFSGALQTALRLSRQVEIPARAVAVHLRAGDIVYGPFRFMNRFSDKAVAYQIASAFIADVRQAGKAVILFGQDQLLCQALARIHGAIWSADLMPTDLRTPATQAMFDIGLMARCETIAAGDSGFAELAALISGQGLLSLEGHFTPARSVDLIVGSGHAPIDLAASDPQKAFSFWKAAHILIEGNSELEQAKKCLGKAIDLDPENGFYVYVLASLHYRERATEAGERLMSQVPTGNAAGAFDFLVSHPASPMKPYLPSLLPAARNGRPWACLCHALAGPTTSPLRPRFAKVALENLSLDEALRQRLAEIAEAGLISS